MKKLFFSLIFLLITGIVFGQQVSKMKITDLEAYIGKSMKPLVITFWATFCKPCLQEIPYFQNTIKEKYDGEVELVLVSLDLPDYYPSKISSFAIKSNFSVPIVWLNETNADYFCPRIDEKWSGAIPATLMINNRKNYRKFYEQQLTPLQLERELKNLAE
jgi:thiol-disulfide isomerase/thioredoxin